MKKINHFSCLLAIFCALSFSAGSHAAIISFDNTDFSMTPVFSNVQNFGFTIDIAGGLTAGTVYSNPTLNSVTYFVNGTLDTTPSGFSGFNLVRVIDGADFYAQGSSFYFEIAASANLNDGLQASELVADGDGLLFNFNAREFLQSPARYHPPLVELYNDGTGRIQNSNNQGEPGENNPGSGLPVDVDFGEEYITDLAFTPSTLTLADAQAVVPVPGAAILFLSALGMLVGQRMHGKE